MFSYFKCIDSNLQKDITKGEDTTSRCVWFTILAGISTEPDEVTGEDKTMYEYFSFPSTARFDVDSDYIEFKTETPYYCNMAQFGIFDF